MAAEAAAAAEEVAEVAAEAEARRLSPPRR